jgi:hypothetical protein
MKCRLLNVLNIALLGTAGTASNAAATEDVLFLSDGRELHGKIVSETGTQIVFEYIDPALKVKTKLTFDKDKVIKINRNVPVQTTPAAGETKPSPSSTPSSTPSAASTTSSGSPKPKKPEGRHAFVARADSDDPNVPGFYIVPMKGQMGTDVNSELYKAVIEDIKRVKPDVVIIKLNCQDTEDVVYSTKTRADEGLVDYDDYHVLVDLFRNEIPNIRQALWVEDSVGISSMVAFAWSEMYMKPTARFGGLEIARKATGFDAWKDEDVRGKMTAAFMAIVKSFLESGKYALVLADAMVRPQYTLSATWKGRDVVWSLDTDGDYVVDNNAQTTTEFRAKDAEDFCLSKGTAETLDDLALLMGYREYRVVDGQGEKLVNQYISDWRRAYETCLESVSNYTQYMSWASGQDSVKYLGKAKSELEKIIAAMTRYKAVSVRLERDYGYDKNTFTVWIERIQERLRRERKAGSTGSGGTGGGGRGGSGTGRGGFGG